LQGKTKTQKRVRGRERERERERETKKKREQEWEGKAILFKSLGMEEHIGDSHDSGPVRKDLQPVSHSWKWRGPVQ
jgi:hypothetical protein